MVDDDSSSGSFSGDSEATLVGEMTVEEFSARMKILAPPLNSKDADLQQELLAKQKEFEARMAAAAATVPVPSLPPCTRETRRLYSYGAIRLSNIKMQYRGALVETKAYKDWLGALPPKEHDLLMDPPNAAQQDVIGEYIARLDDGGHCCC